MSPGSSLGVGWGEEGEGGLAAAKRALSINALAARRTQRAAPEGGEASQRPGSETKPLFYPLSTAPPTLTGWTLRALQRGVAAVKRAARGRNALRLRGGAVGGSGA